MASRLAAGLPYVLALASAAYADDLMPPSQYEGKAVTAVRFVPAVQPATEAGLKKLVGVNLGSPLRLADVRAAIKRLYGTGEYSNVEVDTEPAASGLTLIFHTTNQWFVGPVDARGKINNPPSSSQLANAARLDLGTPFSDSDLDTAVASLKTLLQRNGLYRGTVTPQVVRDSQHQQVAVTFQVNSNKRARLTLPNITGDPKLDPNEVAHAAKYKQILFFPWKLATQNNVQSGLDKIRGKYEKQDRLTADVALDHVDFLSSEYRVRPTIHVDGGPKIKLNAEGAKVSQDTLKTYVPVFDEGTVNEDLLVSGARNLRDYFQNKGYFDVEVDYASRNTSADLQTITYKVSLGEVHRVVRVEIKGNRYFTTGQIRERMYIQPKGFIRLRHGRYSGSFATRDEQSIEALYQDSGFRDCKVSVGVADISQGKKGDVAITMNIAEGPQYLISSLVVNGVTLKDKSAILGSLASLAGQPFSETNVAMDRDAIIGAYQSAGYPDTTFDYRTTPSGTYRVKVQYNITEGEPQYVRDVLVSGLRTSRPRLVNPLITLHPGDPLSWTEMGRMQRRLYNLGVFDKVDMAIQNPDGDEEQKYVDFHCVEGHLYALGIGLGAEIMKIGGSATTISNPNGTTGFAPRVDLQLSRLNLWGLGHSLMFNGRYSTLDHRAALTYSIPRFRNVDGRNITVTGLYDNTRDVLTFTAVKYQGAVQVTQRVDKATNLLFRYSWTDDRVDQTSLKINPLLIPLYSQPSRVAAFAVNLVQDRRDDASDAHHGIYNSLDLSYASHDFGGSVNFLRVLARNSYYKQLPKNMVVASNTEFGVIIPMNTGGIATSQYIPLPERFFSGGESSMRGFATDQAGPRDSETGFPLGGNALFLHSTELRFPFIGDNIQGVLFHDMGNVYTSLGAISFRVHQQNLTDFDYMVHAVGFGIRYKTPLGPLRVDLAYALNPPTFNGLQGTYEQLLFGGAQKTVTNSGHFQFFFSIGQAF
ncbi:MAG: BamA/TamA family outer membrane protein [Candidatus Sulfopaludibacter sp.]|nr:BamA/TamA family outer membrane protein [Candidatus Sulfopaludibacter sp.]